MDPLSVYEAYDLSLEAKKFLANWARDSYYVYIRPDTSKWAEPDEKEGPWFVVTVQVRSLPPHEYRAEGRSLDACVLEIGSRVPRRRDLGSLPPAQANDYIGFLAPQARWNAHYRSLMADKSAAAAATIAWEAEAKHNALTTHHVGPIHDRHGTGRPKDANEKGYGSKEAKEAIKKIEKKKAKKSKKSKPKKGKKGKKK